MYIVAYVFGTHLQWNFLILFHSFQKILDFQNYINELEFNQKSLIKH